MAEAAITATGRRKTSIARVRLVRSGEGTITVNSRALEEYFPRETLVRTVRLPLTLTETDKSVTIQASCNGGGVCGQAEALRHGITRASLKVDSSYRPVLKKEGLVTRDPRMKERKKPGQPGARKRFQYSKR